MRQRDAAVRLDLIQQVDGMRRYPEDERGRRRAQPRKQAGGLRQIVQNHFPADEETEYRGTNPRLWLSGLRL